MQALQGVLEVLVLAVEFLGELLDQVQPLHLQGIAPEHLQGVGHVGDLVVAGNVDRGFQVAAGHVPHGDGQAHQAPNQVTADEQPADEHGAGNAQHGQQHQHQDAGGRGGLGHGVDGDGVGVHLFDQPFHVAQQFGGCFAAGGQRFPFLAQPLECFPA